MSVFPNDVTLDDIKAAAQLIEGEVVRTPLVSSPRLSQQTGAETYLKLESLQVTGSFKARGAFAKLSGLGEDERRRGVIAMSAGNHAQGVAYHAQRLKIPATIVMPEFAPFSKVERTRGYGARVVLTGDTLDAAAVSAREIAVTDNLTFVHPYDDPKIIAGQGTIGLELLTDNPDLEAVLVPIGGGGLISGIAIAVKTINPKIRVIGVETELYPSMYQAINELPARSGGQTLADGIAVKSPGKLTKAIIAELVEEILLVGEEAIESAVHTLAEQQKLVAEGAGAAGIAALQRYRERFAGQRVAVVIGGGNIDARLLSAVLARGLARDGRLVRLRIEILDQPGVLAQVAQIIGRTGGNIIEVFHQRMFYNVPAKSADLDVIVESRNREHVHEIMAALKAGGFNSRILSARSDAGED